MHLPAYAHAAIRAALPALPSSRHVEAVDCCLCDRPFGDRVAVPLGPTPESGLHGCRDCLARLVAQARRRQSTALVRDAARSRAESAAWEAVKRKHLARLGGVRAAAEAVARLSADDEVEAVRVAWLLLSLESAYAWVPEAPEPPPSVGREDSELRDGGFRLDLAMVSAREGVADRLAYHVVNEAAPLDPGACEELECPEGCVGRHDLSEVDCGPDAIFEDLARHGITVDPPEDRAEERPVPPPRSAQRAAGGAAGERFASYAENCSAVLAHFGLAVDDDEVLLDAAAVGLVTDAWRDGPLDEIHAAPDGPGDGEVFAQSVDLYRRARTALAAAQDDPGALAAFVAVASDVRLPWAGESGFRLRSVSGPAAHLVPEFVEHVGNRVWFTTEVMREQGWRTALLHRAVTAAVRAPEHFGMPAWPAVVAAAMPRLAALDRSQAPRALHDLAAVEEALLKAPDRLGAAALDWLAGSAVLLGGPADGTEARS
ncbi:hypothetical protein [Streptomyces griseus]|uniref:hypothetical protein n=1 Tax=Streptomyces griseus TaxID=1911 RepID=UPI0004C79DE3|nr:hypothetical protein [Streptomyces griseus]